MLIAPVTSDANGNFSLTLDYVCANVNDQVYVTATGGNPGQAPGTNNGALVMMSALGRCGDLPTASFVSINELTTVAAAWALAPFISTASSLGATATNAAGLRNGFLNAALLVDPHNGQLAQSTPNVTVETGKLYALANSIASCVNSDGGAGCTPLFAAATPSGGTAPLNTLAATLNVVRNPGNNVAAVFNTASAFAPFPALLSVAPNDWTISMTVRGGGLVQPNAVAVDASGIVWAAGLNSVVSEFTPQGAALSAAGFGAGLLSNTYDLAIDIHGDVWVTVGQQPRHGATAGSVAKFSGSSSGSPGALIGNFYESSLNYPYAIAADTNGNMQIANYASTYGPASVYSNSGSLLLGNFALLGSDFPVRIATDTSHGMWLVNSSDVTVSHIDASGQLLARPMCCNSPEGLALDALGNVWVANYGDNSVSEVSAAGTTTLADVQGGGVYYPVSVAIDGAQNVWLANYLGASISHIAGNGGTAQPGAALSPATGLGLDAALQMPTAVAIDPTGDVWVSNYGNDDLVMFFGLAAPTKTPLGPVPAIP